MEEFEIKDLLYDEVDEKFLAIEKRKQKRKKRQRKIRYSILAIFLSVSLLYFVSDVSKVKSLEVQGNTLYTSDQILTKGGLSYQTRYILVPKFLIEMKLKSDKFIKDVEVYKGLDGAISIKVIEPDIVGIFEEKGVKYALFGDGSTEKIEKEQDNAVLYYPSMGNFKTQQKTKLASAFLKYISENKTNIMQMISEIEPFSASYNANMVEITMQDGNRLYSSYNSIPLLREYQNVLKDLKGSRVCLLMDDSTSSITSIDCNSMQAKPAE